MSSKSYTPEHINEIESRDIDFDRFDTEEEMARELAEDSRDYWEFVDLYTDGLKEGFDYNSMTDRMEKTGRIIEEHDLDLEDDAWTSLV